MRTGLAFGDTIELSIHLGCELRVGRSGARRECAEHDIRTRETGGEPSFDDGFHPAAHEIARHRPPDRLRDDEAESRGFTLFRIFPDMQNRVGDACSTSHAEAVSHDAPVVIAPSDSVLLGWHDRVRANYAVSFERPLPRRAATIARPARVRMRARKPCTLARRRLLGWKVRLLIIEDSVTYGIDPRRFTGEEVESGQGGKTLAPIQGIKDTLLRSRSQSDAVAVLDYHRNRRRPGDLKRRVLSDDLPVDNSVTNVGAGVSREPVFRMISTFCPDFLWMNLGNSLFSSSKELRNFRD